MQPLLNTSKPTEGELEILSILWEKGEATVADVHAALSSYKKTGYTTTLKLLQLMLFKGLVNRKEIGRKHSYWATIDKNNLSIVLTDRLAGYLFNGSPAQLAITAIQSTTFECNQEDLLKLRDLVEQQISNK
ncbi:MAG: BlaI/MecI/CopY family transcriptional regulator [Bacteroidetes bacterium]|nr:BlaI/MecI/CopY family transcriptional regulator [Bacteroidota bacterium]